LPPALVSAEAKSLLEASDVGEFTEGSVLEGAGDGAGGLGGMINEAFMRQAVFRCVFLLRRSKRRANGAAGKEAAARPVLIRRPQGVAAGTFNG
jgi:hypothetical protein